MAEAATFEVQIPESLAELRALTEVNNLRCHLRPDGSVDTGVMHDVEINHFTAIQEMAIPSAVTTTVQRVETQRDAAGRSRRTIKWLGKSAIDVAMSGYQFHVSDAAHRRVDCEVAEAEHSQEHLKAGEAQVFISPKMSRSDASAEIAKAEHLHADDAVRVSYPVTDKMGEVVARRIESLLVTDIPLEAWMSMLRSPDNLFGKSFDIRDDTSALSVMELFSRLSLPDDKLPQGPVTILEAVRPYITDADASASVTDQIWRFKASQDEYRRQAEKFAAEWLQFDLELARSLEQGIATLEIEGFVATLQHEWNTEDLQTILSHDVAGEYIMTTQLAALLENAKRNLLASQVALATGNRKVLAQTDDQTAERLTAQMRHLDAMRLAGVDASEIAFRQAHLTQSFARQNFTVGGGCAGTSSGSFGKKRPSGEQSTSDSEADMSTDGDEVGQEGWTWKKGVCRVKKCPSPKPTEVGPCEVCRGCQHKFDQGLDPTVGGAGPVTESVPSDDLAVMWKSILEKVMQDRRSEDADVDPDVWGDGSPQTKVASKDIAYKETDKQVSANV